MSTLHIVQEGNGLAISTDELRDRLGDPALTIVDVRPLAAYNGWRLRGEVRGGHIPGAVAFPGEWLRSVDAAEIERLLRSKGVEPGRSIVIYGDGPDDTVPLASHLLASGLEDVRTYDAGWSAWAADESLPVERPAELRQAGAHRLAARRARGRAARGRPGDPPRALPRELRGTRGVRRRSHPGRPLSRHQLARVAGRLEPPDAGRARSCAAVARDHGRHDRDPLRARHRG